MTKTQTSIANMLRKAGRKVVVIDETKTLPSPLSAPTIQAIESLQLKAALKQTAFESCSDHIWTDPYYSQIEHPKSSSAVCIRCGERRALTEIRKDPNAKWDTAPQP